MKFFILLVALVGIAAAAEYSAEHEKVWLDFKLDHGKLFLSPGKEEARKECFLKKYEEVKEHNEAFESDSTILFKKGINQFSDLPEDVFMSRFGGVDMPAEARNTPESERITLRGTPPRSLDLSASGGVGAVRDQNPCGSCWAFSTNAALEYAYWKKSGGKSVVDLSEQNLVDCVYNRDGCKGGWMPTAMDYIRDNAIATEEEYPYIKTMGTCAKSKARRQPCKMKTKTNYQIADDDNSIKQALNDYGVLAICVDATDWGSYTIGIFSNKNYANPQCQHAVALVGYGEEWVHLDPNSQEWTLVPYWKIRNSWGNSWWGELGYIRVDARRCPQTGKNLGGYMTDLTYRPDIA